MTGGAGRRPPRIGAGRLAALVALSATGVPAPVRAQGGARSALVLELPASARAVALAGAVGALGGDDAALFHNPAQLATLPRRAAGLSVQRYLASSTLGALAGGARLRAGVVALGVQTLSYGSVQELVPDPASGGERGVPTGASVSAGELAVTAGYARSFGRFRAGLSGTAVHQRVAAASGSSVAAGVGLAWEPLPRATLGVAAQHLGHGVPLAGTRAPLPRTLRLGAAVHALDRGPLALLVCGEVQQVVGDGARWAGGVEGSWQSPGRARIVGRLGGVAGDAGAGDPLAFGGSLVVGGLAIDYAYRGFDALGGTHRVGARWLR